MEDERKRILRERDVRRQNIKFAMGAALVLLLVIGFIVGIVVLAMP